MGGDCRCTERVPLVVVLCLFLFGLLQGLILTVKGVAAVFTGGRQSAVPALIYFRNKRKRVGMKLEI